MINNGIKISLLLVFVSLAYIAAPKSVLGAFSFETNFLRAQKLLKLSGRFIKISTEASTSEISSVSPYLVIDVNSDFAGSWIILNDLDNDGIDELISAKNYSNPEIDEHFTSSISVQKLDGTNLWQWGDPNSGRNLIHHDVAAQVIDWDLDGMKEIVIAADGWLVALDGQTGREVKRFQIPKHASDMLLFANLTDNDYLDVIVKNRYSEIYAYSYTGDLLWELKNEPYPPHYLAHSPLITNMDSDVYDEVLVGFELLDNDGSHIWKLTNEGFGLTLNEGHLDSAVVFTESNDLESKRIAITGCGNQWVAMIDGNGKLIWTIEGEHYEAINIGNVLGRTDEKQIIVDIDHMRFNISPLQVIDGSGEIKSEIITPESRFHTLVSWREGESHDIAIGGAHALYNGHGEILLKFDFPFSDIPHETVLFKSDIDNDGIEELIFHYNPIDKVYIFKNPFPNSNQTGQKPDITRHKTYY